MNYDSVDRALKSVTEVKVPAGVTSKLRMKRPVPDNAPDFVKEVTGVMIAGRGDRLPVSRMPADGTWPTGTTRYEKRNIAYHIPIWEPRICIQCGLCSFVCPHATIRMKAYDGGLLSRAPQGFKSVDATGKELTGLKFTVQVAPEDCTGCGSCVHVCPAHGKDDQGNKLPDFKAINMRLQEPLREAEARNYDFFLGLPETDPSRYAVNSVKGSQFRQPLFEYHSSCAGCGETPYIRLLSQLFGDRLYIANATGCTSIYGGNLPTHPYTTRSDGRGPTWSNSLFEDNAEFGFGMSQAVAGFYGQAVELVNELFHLPAYGKEQELLSSILNADQTDQAGIEEQRKRVDRLKALLARDKTASARSLLSLADHLVKKSVWAIGGDGWGYDIGYGGLDHVLASGENVNLLVLDTEVYSNTGGQTSKATPLAAQAEFAAAGKRTPKKNMGMIMATYGSIYVAQVAFGANPVQTLTAFLEAEAFKGPSLILAYSTCIAQGIDMSKGVDEMKRAVACGHWPLYRYNPAREAQGKNPLIIDSTEPTISFAEYAYNETRYRALRQAEPGTCCAADGTGGQGCEAQVEVPEAHGHVVAG
jgi:pyruvate-ferredoxin/flavodoxin oxidoreductase